MKARLQPGQRVGRWRLEQLLGRGGYGSTWRATGEDGRPGALKVLREPPGDELRALARVCHPAVVAVLDAGGEPVPYVVMELARGRSLGLMLRAGPAPVERAQTITAVLVDALAAVHGAGLTHGDVKPDNVIVSAGADGRIWLVDFGLAGQAHGGSLPYAAPEQTSGQHNAPPADVYALGLVLWEMLHGALPWPELELSASIPRRRQEVPQPSIGPDWLRELIRAMLAVDPARRPAASAVADTFAAHGARLPQPDADLLRRRARVLHVRRVGLDEAIHRWLAEGGALAITGPQGSGRSHALDGAVVELQARGVPWLRLVPSESPWGPVEHALADPGLVRPGVPLPGMPDPIDRAEAAAAALEDRAPAGLSLVVDDVDQLDDGTAATLAALARRRRASILCAGPSAPTWATHTVALEPLDAPGMAALVTGVLGASEPLDVLIARTHDISGGLPGSAVAFLLAAVSKGAVLRRNWRWLVDEARLERVAFVDPDATESESALPEDVRHVGAVIALHATPIPAPVLVSVTRLDEAQVSAALDQIVERGLVRVEAGLVRCVSRAARATLGRGWSRPRELHRALVEVLERGPSPPWDRIGWHIVGAHLPGRAVELGAQAIAEARQKDPRDAARLADALWALAPVSALAGPRIEALVAAGRADEARTFGERHLENHTTNLDDVPVLVSLGRLYSSYARDDEAAMRCVQRAQQALGDRPVPLELLDLEANVCFHARRFDDAIRVARAVAERPAPEDPGSLDRWLSLRGVWAQALERSGDLRTAIAVLEALPDDQGRGRPARALLDGMLGRLLWHAGKIREASRLMARASEEGAGLPALDRAKMLHNAALCSYAAGDLGGAISSWEQALLLFERLRVGVEQVHVQVNLAVGYREAGRWERARQACAWALERSQALGLPDLEAMSAGNLGDLHLARHQWEDAERYYAVAAEVAEKHGLAGEKAELARRRAEMAVLRGTPDALELARTAERVASRANIAFERSRAEALIAVCHARAGRVEAVEEALARAMEPLRKTGAARELAEVRLWAAEARLALGRTDQALDECSKVTVYAEEGGHVLLRNRADEIASRARAGEAKGGSDERLGRLLELAVDVARERDLPRLLDRIAESAMDLLVADRAFVILDRGILDRASRGAPADDLVVAASRVREDVPPGPLSMSVVRLSIERRREVIAPDVVERGDLRAAQSVRAMHIRMVMCMPLVDGEDVLGAIYVDSLTASEQVLSEVARFLRGLAAFAAVAVTNARHLHEAERRAARAAEVAHDLSKPVAVLVGLGRELADRPALEPGLRDGLDDIVVYGERALSLARSLLGDRARSMRAVNFARVALMAVDEATREARRRGVYIELEGPDPLTVRGDADELHRALTNLLSNALKYSPRGGTIRVELEERDGVIVCRVRDQGPGIPAEAMDTIFERGVQGPGAVEGHGLGLTIARRVIQEDHGGELLAENLPEGGAMFTTRLPVLAESTDARHGAT